MKCFICNNNMLPYFKKEFPKIFIGGGGQQDFLQFIKCGHCGLVIDQTTY